jgi:ribonuclease HI
MTGSVYTLSRGWRFRLESVGPTGEKHPQTSQRAELRAAIAALATIKWADEGWLRVTIASDSAYLVQGITENIDKWRQRGWRNTAGKPVANRDLWQALLSQVNLHAHWGCQIRFWLIPRELNGAADELAKYIAEHGKGRTVTLRCHGSVGCRERESDGVLSGMNGQRADGSHCLL